MPDQTASSVATQRLTRIQRALDHLVDLHGEAALSRVFDFVRLTASGIRPELPPMQDPALFYFPGLDDRPWYEPDDFPELRQIVDVLEANFPVIRDEYLRCVRHSDLISYEQQISGARELREGRGEAEGLLLPSANWGTFSLRIGGEKLAENCARCPQTAAVLTTIEKSLDAAGAAFFSVVGPKSRIPPHVDTVNTRLTVHLGLVIPRECGIRVANEARRWQEGRCLIFEDTFQHEAWNDSYQPRSIFMLDICHPRLTAIERQAVEELRVLYNT